MKNIGNVLNMHKTQNGNYISPKISKEKLLELCENYFYILLIKNKEKKNEFDNDYFIIINGDKSAICSK